MQSTSQLKQLYSWKKVRRAGINTFKEYLIYSEIPLLRPPKIKTYCQLKTLFAKFKLFVSSFSSPCVSLIRDHLLDSPKGGLNIGILLYLFFSFLVYLFFYHFSVLVLF